MTNQSLYVLAALVAVMVFSLHQRRAVVRTDLTQIEHDLTATADARARALTARLENLPFDPAIPVETVDSLSVDPDVADSTSLGDFLSLNDAHALSEDTVYTDDSLEFVRSADVQFVEPDSTGAFSETADPRFYKEVTVTLESTVPSVSASATRTRVYSYVPTP